MNIKRILGHGLLMMVAFSGMAVLSNSHVSANAAHHGVPFNTKIKRIDLKQNHKNIVNNRNSANAKMPRLRFIAAFPDEFKGARFPQSINLGRRERNLYLGFDSYSPDGSKVIRYDLKKRRFHAGPTFKGGHAQGVSLNRRTNRLWFINKSSNASGDDHSGIITRGHFVDVSSAKLKPVARLKIKLKWGRYFNNSLAFSDHGAFISVNTKRFSKRYPYSLMFYNTKFLNTRYNHWHRLKTVITHFPRSATLEYLAYNPRSLRLYLESEAPNEIWSLPVDKLLNNTLKRRDIYMARLPLKRLEPEGITFTNHGYAYLLFGGKGPWIGSVYKTKRPISF